MTSTRNDSRNEHWFQQFVQPTGSAYIPYLARALALVLRFLTEMINSPQARQTIEALTGPLLLEMHKTHPMDEEDGLAGGMAFVRRICLDDEPICAIEHPGTERPNPTVRLTGAACEANPTALAYGLYVTLFAVVHGDLSVELTDRSQGRDVAEVRKLLPRIRLDMTPYHPPMLH